MIFHIEQLRGSAAYLAVISVVAGILDMVVEHGLGVELAGNLVICSGSLVCVILHAFACRRIVFGLLLGIQHLAHKGLACSSA